MKSVYTGFFAKQIIGPKSIDDYLLQAVASELENTIGAVCGEAVLDPSGAGVGLGITTSADTLNNRKITVTGDKQAVTDNGDLITCGSTSTERTYTSGSYTIKSHDDDWFEDIPYENNSGTTYYIYIGQTKFPVDVGSARDGSRGYSVWADAAGFTVNPNSVTLSGGKIILKLDAVLTALNMPHWLTTNTENASWSMDCIVWLDTDQVGVSVQTDDPAIAIAVAKLTKDAATSAWRVDLTAIGDGKLGQSVVSTTAVNYKVAILGPLITTTNALKSNPAYVFIGTVLSGVGETVSTAGQPVTIPYASYAAGFSVEHNGVTSSPDLGLHKQVTAQADTDLNIMVNSAASKNIRLGNKGAGSSIVVIEDLADITEIRQAHDFTVDLLDNAFTRYVWMRNSGTDTLEIYLDAEVVASKTTGGTGNFTARGSFYIDSTDLYGAHLDALTMYEAAFHNATGAGVLQYSGGGGVSVPFLHITGGIAATKTALVPIHPPLNFDLRQLRVHYMKSAAGAPVLRVAVGRWTEGTAAIINVTGWQVTTDVSGNFVTEVLALAGNVLTVLATEKFFLMIELTNDGIADSTVKLHKVSLLGYIDQMPMFQR